MENPCEKCILKGNCTEVCFKKTNYGVLLKQGIESHWSLIRSKNTNYWKRYRKFINLLANHTEDELVIQQRRLDAEYGLF